MKYILHTSILQCEHGGTVSLDRATNCGIKINNKYPVLKQHIINATITGCPQQYPCAVVVSVPESCYAEHQMFNNDQILTDKIHQKATTNAGGIIKVISV